MVGPALLTLDSFTPNQQRSNYQIDQSESSIYAPCLFQGGLTRSLNELNQSRLKCLQKLSIRLLTDVHR